MREYARKYLSKNAYRSESGMLLQSKSDIRMEINLCVWRAQGKISFNRKKACPKENPFKSSSSQTI
jgi:hypothetical protein